VGEFQYTLDSFFSKLHGKEPGKRVHYSQNFMYVNKNVSSNSPLEQARGQSNWLMGINSVS